MNVNRPLTEEVGGYFISRVKEIADGVGGLILKTTAFISGAACTVQPAEVDDAFSEIFL